MRKRLMDLLKRCAAVIDGEIRLLDRWRKRGAMGPGGKAACRLSILRISVGETSSQVIVNNILAKADALSDTDIKNPPSAASADFVKNAEQSLKTRSTWDGPDLDPPWLESALAQAEDNAAHTADVASGILADCVG